MTTAPAQDPELLAAARAGDERAFQRLVEPHQGELHAHCYRMLGSTHDAEDALQETMLRAWRGLPRFEGRSSLRTWLYRIATNTSLNAVEKRPKRVLPVDYGPPSDPHGGPGEPMVESVWIEPYPDERIAIEDGLAWPEARYEQREAIELAFIGALQHLAPNQRAVLILRDVLGFSAQETADTLDTTTASANSALQRARETVDTRVPDQSQQETLQELGDEETRELVSTYVDAWLRDDVDTVVQMLTDDVTFAMPPLGTWFKGSEVALFLEQYPMSGAWKWKTVLSHANGQPAIAFYTWDEEAGTHQPFALNVLTLRGDRISDVCAFIVRSIEDPDADYERFPDQPADQRRLEGVFGAFGLPEQLD